MYDCYFLVRSAHEEKRVNSLLLLNMKVTLLTSILILLHSMVNRCKNPEIHAVARSELNSWVGYLVNFISNRFLSYKTHIWNRIRAKTNGKPWRQHGGLTDEVFTLRNRFITQLHRAEFYLNRTQWVAQYRVNLFPFLEFPFGAATGYPSSFIRFLLLYAAGIKNCIFHFHFVRLWKITFLSHLACKPPLTN